MFPIYLDHNATTPIDPAVVAAMVECWERGWMNPASPHEAGRQARRMLEMQREAILVALGAVDQQLLFVSGGTEANNLALLGLAGEPPARILVSAIEHPSVVEPARRLAALGFDVRWIPVTGAGVVDLPAFHELLTPATRLVAVMLANNETGVLQPVAELATLCRQRGIHLHTDAVQMVGKMTVDFLRLGVDSLSFTAHKMHGPLGIGGLLLRRGLTLTPLLYGGFQQQGLRPGTESVALAVGLGTAIFRWQQDRERTARLEQLRDQLESLLLAGDPGAVIVGGREPRLPHTTCVTFPGLDRQALLMALDLAGLACSTGSACASGSSEPSSVLRAMGLPAAQIQGALRLSCGARTTSAEMVRAAELILDVVKDLRARKVAAKGTP